MILSKDKYDENKYIELDEKLKIIFVYGGDGTLLKAINRFKHLNLPFYPIARGSVNFLMNKEVIDESQLMKFRLIKAKIKTFTSEIEIECFNDIMVGGTMNSWIHFDVEDSNHLISNFSGGGIIFSTPQGSTGINKSNGGSILPLDDNTWSITGDKTNKKINITTKPNLIIINAKSRTNITLWGDGENNVIDNICSVEFSEGSEVSVIINDIDEFKKRRTA